MRPPPRSHAQLLVNAWRLHRLVQRLCLGGVDERALPVLFGNIADARFDLGFDLGVLTILLEDELKAARTSRCRELASSQ